MLNSGIKFKITISKEDILEIDLILSFLGYLINFGLAFKNWKIAISKKDYSSSLFFGPVHFSIINLEKMNKYLNNALKERANQDYTEM